MNLLTRRELFAAGLALGLIPMTTALSAQTQPSPPDRTIEALFRDFTADWVRHNPNLATSTRFFTGEEQDRLERQLTPQTREWRLARIQLARRGLAELHRYERNRLTELQRLAADVMEWQLDTVVREEPFLDYTFPLEQMRGANVQLVETLIIRHSLRNERDAENYVAALGQVGTRMNEAIEEAGRLESKHIVPPRFILDVTIRQMQAFVDSGPRQNPFVAALVDRMGRVKQIPERRQEQLRAEAEKIVATQVCPAWTKGIAMLQAQWAQATDDAGLWRFKEGPAIYAEALARFTTTRLTADEIHELGLAQVRRLETEMDDLLRRLGRADGSVQERIEQLKLDLQYANPASEESRARIMRDIDGFIEDAERRVSLLFDLRPKSPVIAQPFPRFLEDSAAANYNGPSLDGSRPGTFQYPRRIENMTRFGLRSLVYHETVPGHHFQIALEIENQDRPRFLQIRAFGSISASGEGWALYAERLAAESGWYDTDPEGRLGQLDYELFRARRLVVDTGLHAKRWTRRQAIEYGIEPSEVDRYVVYAGQACSYMIGELKILELRDQARKALGKRFSLRDFHNVVLTTGTVPLDLLAREVDRYVSAMMNS